MEILIPFLPVLGCLAMGVVMVLMMRGHHAPAQNTTGRDLEEEVNRLRAEVALLKRDRDTAGQQSGDPGTRL